MKRSIQIAAVLCFMVVYSVCLAASEKNSTGIVTKMEEVVVTATRSEEKVKSVPVKVEVIDAQNIEKTVAQTITEQLKKNASIGVVEYPGALAGIGIRGFRPEISGITKHSLILINGRPAGATNLATILSDNIERIEMLKGPASSLYGGEAMGGVVNVITKKNTGEFTGLAEIGFGSFNTTFQKMAAGGSLGKLFDFDLSANTFNQADDFKMGNGDSRANTSYQTQNGSLRLGSKIGAAWRMDLSCDVYKGYDIETPGDIFNGDDKQGHKDIDRYGLDFTLGGKVSENNRLSFTAYKTNETVENYYHYSSSYGPAPDYVATIVPVVPYQSYDSDTDWVGMQIKNEYNLNNHTIIAGIDYQDIVKKSRYYNQDGTRKSPYSPDEGRENQAAYLETIWRFIDKRLTATIGGRYDSFEIETKSTPHKTDFTPNSKTFSTFSPRAGLNYLFEQGIRLHATIGTAFVPPSAWQLAGYEEDESTGMITMGNTNLDAETSLTYDMGIGYELLKIGLSCDVTYFHTDVNDKITKETNGNIKTYKNSLDAEMDGLETMLSFDIGAPLQWEQTLSIFVNSTHIFKAEEELADGTMKDIHNVAEQTINYGIQYDDDAFDGKLQVRNQGKMKDTDWNVSGYPEIECPSFTVADLMLGYSFTGHHKFSFKVDNIFDEDYYEKNGYPKPGRSFFASYRYKF